MSKPKLFLLYILLTFSFSIKAQSKLIIHSESIDSLFCWFNNKFPADKIPDLLKLPANQIMEQLLLENEKDASTFTDALHNFIVKDSSINNDYLLNDAYNKQKQIRILMDTLTEFTIKSQPIESVREYFPIDFKPSSQYDVFFSSTGWQWGDAMTFNYSRDENKFTISQEGTPAIIFNLTIILSTYGETLEKQVASYKRVLSHELFHALLNEYIMEREYYNPDQIESKTLFTLMNEGIAHYIADGDYIRANYKDLKEKEQHCFSLFNEKAKIIFDKNKDMTHRNKALEEGLFGSYWEKYISATGLFMAHHIYERGGKKLFRECIENGYDSFLKMYNTICNTNSDLPRLLLCQ